jgi:hypothetical protein
LCPHSAIRKWKKKADGCGNVPCYSGYKKSIANERGLENLQRKKERNGKHSINSSTRSRHKSKYFLLNIIAHLYSGTCNGSSGLY